MGDFKSLSFDNSVFAAYAFYAAFLVAKMIFVQSWTGVQRQLHVVPALPEDAMIFRKDKDSKTSPKENENVERVRRCLINDLENIPTFLILSLAYILTGPTPSIAIWHFRIFTVGRVVHTITYLMALQPYRSIAYAASFSVCVSVVIQVILYTL